MTFDLAELTRDLIQIKSVANSNYQAFSNKVANMTKRLGFSTKLVEGPGGFTSVVAVVPGATSLDLVMDVHLDTVEP